MLSKKMDQQQIDAIVDTVFHLYIDGMYFDEFVQLNEKVTCEFSFSILDCLYQSVPCL